jgi:hypothetical protein
MLKKMKTEDITRTGVKTPMQMNVKIFKDIRDERL